MPSSAKRLTEGRYTICGITGFIGRSSHPEVTFELMTALFKHSEVRGSDAAGFWGTEVGDNGRIIYHKEPVKAVDFVKSGMWNGVKSLDLNLLLVHARGASQGVGHAYTNMNNHPFVSADKSTALVHNGRIPDSEYDVLKNKYQVKSNCDSEILLRIFEASEAYENMQEVYDDPAEWQITARLRALRNIWSQVIKGHMAVAIGERLGFGERRLWMFRNKHRPLWLVDLRQQLGQVVFVSTPEIWQASAASCRLMQPFVERKIKLIELPTEEIFVMKMGTNNDFGPGFLRKFDVQQGGFTTYDYKGDPYPIGQSAPVAKVLTRLNDNDVVQHGQPDTVVVKKNDAENDNETSPSGNSGLAGSIQNVGGLANGPVVNPWWDVAEQMRNFYEVPHLSPANPLLFPPLPDLTTAKEEAQKMPARKPSLLPPKKFSTHTTVRPVKDFEEDPYPSSMGDLDESDLEEILEEEEMLHGMRVMTEDDMRSNEFAASNYTIEEVSKLCRQIVGLAEQIETSASNKKMEGSMSDREFEELLESLMQTSVEMDGTLQILNNS